MEPLLYAVLGLLFVVMFSLHRLQAGQLLRLERKVNLLLQNFELSGDPRADGEVLELARSGRKIEAIKRYRDLTGASLKDAKDYVERL